MALKIFTVTDGFAGIRAVDWLRTLFPDLKESDVRRLFSSRDVKLDGRPVRRDEILKSGQELKVYLPDALEAGNSLPALRIVYEDGDVLLADKPAGMSVEPDAAGGISLTELCRLHAGPSSPYPPVPCHRLDVKTCGLCLFAKNDHAAGVLLEAFRSRAADKYYECLVRGVMKPPSAVCRAYLLKDAERARVTILDRPVPGTRPIATGYETIESGPVSRLRVRLITGRTHQIRAHLAAMNHPILGDDLYGDRAFNRAQKARSLKLCAVSLTLHTGGQLPQLDGREFTITPPF